eukprot:2704779-Rhodomonas_salina.2
MVSKTDRGGAAARWKDVKFITDLGLTAMRDAIFDFLQTEMDVDACVFAFVGHGIEVNGNHYLVPKDARLQNSHKDATDFEEDVGRSCISLMSASIFAEISAVHGVDADIFGGTSQECTEGLCTKAPGQQPNHLPARLLQELRIPHAGGGF